MILAKPKQRVELSADDRAELKTFLDRESGKRIMEVLAYLAPDALNAGEAHVMLHSAGVRKGFELAIEEFYRLVTPQDDKPVPEVAPRFPDLDDEKMWQEADTLNRQESKMSV